MERKTITVTFRVPAALERRVAAYARDRGLSRSDVLRTALDRLLADEERGEAATLRDQLAPWIGVVDSGGRHPAREHKRIFAEHVERKHRARRPR